MAMGALTTSALLTPGSAGASQLMTMGSGVNTTGLFGVFDGHGGVEVAEFCSRNFEEVFKSSIHYK